MNHRIRLEFEGYDLDPRFDGPGKVIHDKCLRDALEIRDGHPFDGNFYCGDDWSRSGSTRASSSFTSISNWLILILHSNPDDTSGGNNTSQSYKNSRGRFRARMTFVAEDDKVTQTSTTIDSLLPQPSQNNNTDHLLVASVERFLKLPVDVISDLLRGFVDGFNSAFSRG